MTKGMEERRKGILDHTTTRLAVEHEEMVGLKTRIWELVQMLEFWRNVVINTPFDQLVYHCTGDGCMGDDMPISLWKVWAYGDDRDARFYCETCIEHYGIGQDEVINVGREVEKMTARH